ncbi:hypothetical protein CRG98_024541 [Punica granatum]|uniref:Uncharacterized protein n=1 Tax=Punica granatum TaxID=22663 RepID=A0A2I0JFN4_PUNGR|nr:hypothetical protein CRG98_024541 [Punica granatum]
MPTTSVEGSGSSIGGPNPESTGNLRLGVLSRFRFGAANRRSRPPPSKLPASTVGTNDLGGGVGVGVANWQSRLPFPFDFLYKIKMKQNEKLRMIMIKKRFRTKMIKKLKIEN